MIHSLDHHIYSNIALEISLQMKFMQMPVLEIVLESTEQTLHRNLKPAL